MEQRTFVLPAILTCSLLSPLWAHTAAGQESHKASAPAPAPVAQAASPKNPIEAAPASSASAKLPAPKNPIEAALQQVVMLERAGRPIAIGTLLSGDGRILTALSPLTHGNAIDAHYPEGQIVRVRISHSDRAWDLALLTPEGDARHAGLKASRAATPAAGTKLHAVSYVRDKQLGSQDITIKAKSMLRGADSAELPDVLELPFAPKPVDLGAPLLNDDGEVVAVVARACSSSDKTGCTLAPYAAPVAAIRRFLRAVPMRRGPWLGLEAVAFDAGVARGVRVAGIAPQGPAASAGLRAGPPGVGDVVVAVNGTPVATAEAFANAVDTHTAAPGGPLRLMVLSDGHYHEVTLTVTQQAGGPRDGGPSDPALTNPPSPTSPTSPARTWPRAPRPTSMPNPYR